MPSIQSVTVYCSSSKDVAPVYLDAAAELGRAIAREGWQLVYGGNDCGCMSTLANGAREAGGKVIGITPQLLVDLGISDSRCDELIVKVGRHASTAGTHGRTAGDAVVHRRLPARLGTLEEIFEILVGRVLGFHAKPVVLLNIANFYDPLLAMLEHGIDQKFIKPKAREHLHLSATVESAIAHLRS